VVPLLTKTFVDYYTRRHVITLGDASVRTSGPKRCPDIAPTQPVKSYGSTCKSHPACKSYLVPPVIEGTAWALLHAQTGIGRAPAAIPSASHAHAQWQVGPIATRATSRWNTCNIRPKQLKHLQHTSETLEKHMYSHCKIYVTSIWNTWNISLNQPKTLKA
jgi:hypothetical protein